VAIHFQEIISRRHEIGKEWKEKGGKVIGWYGSNVPEEIIHAAGFLPVALIGHYEAVSLADTNLEIQSCAYLRHSYDSALRGEYDYLDGIVFAHHCDVMTKLYDIWRYTIPTPYIYLINAPHLRTRKAHDFFVEEIERFMRSLEEFAGKKISVEDLRHSVQVYNDNRSLLQKMDELRKREPPLISGTEMLEGAIASTLLPKQEANKLLTQFLEELPTRAQPSARRPRLLLIGCVLDNSPFVKAVEEWGADIVADDLRTSFAYFREQVVLDSQPLLDAIATRYLDRNMSPHMFYSLEEKFAYLMNLLKEYKAEGVIFHSLKYCDPYIYEYPYLRDRFQENNIPVLYLEDDHLLPIPMALRTRLEAFLELITGG
jgi:benzoyl-CoA reductase subunit C